MTHKPNNQNHDICHFRGILDPIQIIGMFSNVESFFLTLTFTLACGEELPQSIFHRLTGLGWAEAASLSLAPEARSQIYAAQKLQ